MARYKVPGMCWHLNIRLSVESDWCRSPVTCGQSIIIRRASLSLCNPPAKITIRVHRHDISIPVKRPYPIPLELQLGNHSTAIMVACMVMNPYVPAS